MLRTTPRTQAHTIVYFTGNTTTEWCVTFDKDSTSNGRDKILPHRYLLLGQFMTHYNSMPLPNVRHVLTYKAIDFA